ncbi:MAG: hypothetical protein L6Q60_04520 [Rhodocyclaceae bacterium]|nr:hypothetical protein [Rhodocyclaceae bacterium]
MKEKLALASTLIPPFWLAFLWIYALSANAASIAIPVALFFTLLMAAVSSYCVVMFLFRLRRVSAR